MPREILKPRHLGDGVYIHDNGYAIELAVNHHENKVIVMEDFVIKAFIQYVKESKFIK